ncbi:MAG: DUF1638 domain-containing protein [Candidatus Hydrogenedentes bacterium]|nr:DUF1638 domain-containing protein [Candidatus Hydrogenedentota bacterium]
MDAIELRRKLRIKLKNVLPKRFAVISCHVLWREIAYYSSQLPHSYNFCFLEQGLHDSPELLQQIIQDKVEEFDTESYDAILIGYGLCGKGLASLKAGRVPLVVVRAHDCITLFLGSRKRYKEYFSKHPGTYWFTPGWIEDNIMPGPDRDSAVREIFRETYGEENVEFIIKSMENWKNNYDTAVYIDLGIGNRDWAREYTKKCANYMGWKYKEMKGDPSLLLRWLFGNWSNSNDFLVLEPGEKLVPTFNDEVFDKVSD